MMRRILFVLAASFVLTGTMSHAQAPAATQVVPAFSHVIPNIPGKSLVAVEVTYPPGATSQPHTHAKSGFIFGYILSGTIVHQLEGEPERTLTAGQTFFENPGAHHIVGRNASKTEAAKFIAVFVVDTNETVLTIPDKQ
jgi:quercetin dioxygenase-like cupin family protein